MVSVRKTAAMTGLPVGGLMVIALIAAVFLRSIRFDALKTETVARGKTVACLYAGQHSDPRAGGSFEMLALFTGYPASSGTLACASSTDWWRRLVADMHYASSWEIFSLPGIPAVTGEDPRVFTASNNAWCVVADLEGPADEETPFVFTRNIAVSRLNEKPVLTDDPPFGRRLAVVVTKGGAGFAVESDAELQALWRTAGLSNRVLRP